MRVGGPVRMLLDGPPRRYRAERSSYAPVSQGFAGDFGPSCHHLRLKVVLPDPFHACYSSALHLQLMGNDMLQCTCHHPQSTGIIAVLHNAGS